MEATVPQDHPLRQFFGTLTERNFTETLGWPDFNVTDYLSDLLVEFSHIDRLHRIQNQQGQSVEAVVDLLFESETHTEVDSLEREREVHRHIGDFTLFIAGLFPEYLSYLKSEGMIYHKDHLVDYMKAGKRSYGIVATSQDGDSTKQQTLFQKLSSNFELCVTGLGFVRQDLNRMGHSPYHPTRDLLLH